MGTAVTSQFVNARSTGLRAVWDQETIKYGNTLLYKSLGFADEDALTRESDLYFSMVGSGDPVQTAERQNYAEDEIFESYKVSPSLKKFTKALSITEELDRFDLTPGKQIRKKISDVVKGFNRFINKQTFGILDQGWTGNLFVGGDSLNLFSTVHPLSPKFSTTTQSNIVNDTNPQLNYETLNDAVLQMGRFQDGRGDEASIEAKMLLIGPENLKEAKKALNSELAPDTANNDTNIFKNGGDSRITVMSSKYIDRNGGKKQGEGKWFLIDTDIAPDCLKVSWAWKPRLSNELVRRNGTEYYYGSVMFAPFFCDWRAIIGSNGTNA